MKIKINNPCPEIWDNMKDIPGGKFCDKCAKNIIDFSNSNDYEIERYITHSKTPVCGKILDKNRIKTFLTASFILIAGGEFVHAQSQKISENIIGSSYQDTSINFSGTLLNKITKNPIPNAEVYFIHLKKYIKAITNKNGDFSLKIPKKFVSEKNVLYIDFTKIVKLAEKTNDTLNYFKNEKIIVSQESLLRRDTYNVSPNYYTLIGDVSVTNEPDLYYFNGKHVSKRKFSKLKKENSNYLTFSFQNSPAKIIAKKRHINNLNLLYSN
ncbi:hypothetical protein GCM10023210_17880 [Chryseobacterium ginsengisoli]|uniref:Carboxypeptidase-like regulatory domain-containing protein n=1 Tax=Chryseobacterium ginsengisoli TaxID=363853 RepID=A0ABP9M8E4_9FLAO